MNAIIENKLKEIYSTFMRIPNQVLDIFNNFFGEDKVDMQGFPSIDRLKEWIDSVTVEGLIARYSDIFDTRNYDEYRGKKLDELSDEECILILDNARDFIKDLNFKKGFIIVHFPHVRITNEFDRYVDINHLYAKINILTNGTINGYFALNRSEYPYLHISSNYMHSHVRRIPTSNFTEFQIPCTGSGPIRDTMSNLSRDFDPNIWELFCLELSKYVEVESIEGTPYHRLENIGASNKIEVIDTFTLYNHLPNYYCEYSMFRDFTSYFIKQGKLKFDYRDGSYSIGMSFIDYILTISNVFIDWYNEKFRNKEYTYTLSSLKDKNILKNVIKANGKLYSSNSIRGIESYKEYIGKKICTFKGKDVLLTITDIDNIQGENESIILDPPLALYILSKILKVINYRYGKSKHTNSEGNTVSETIRYI